MARLKGQSVNDRGHVVDMSRITACLTGRGDVVDVSRITACLTVRNHN